MDLWTAIVIIVLIASISGVVKSRNEHGRASRTSDDELEKLVKRIGEQEKRISNLESIIFDMEKERSYDSLG